MSVSLQNKLRLTKAWPVKGNNGQPGCVRQWLQEVAPREGAPAKAVYQEDGALPRLYTPLRPRRFTNWLTSSVLGRPGASLAQLGHRTSPQLQLCHSLEGGTITGVPPRMPRPLC